MRRSLLLPRRLLARFCVALAMMATIGLLPAGSFEKVLYRFKPGNNDAYSPVAPLIADGSGNLYGTTEWGGGQQCAIGCGAVFKIAPDGTETLLHIFAGGTDGADPFGGLLMDAKGDLFGTTSGYYLGYGTVFQLTPDGTHTVLHVFEGGTDGLITWSTPVADSGGNLYGTTEFGANTGCLNGLGCGIVYKVSPRGNENILYTFKGSPDGGNSVAGLIRDSAGNLYGTTGEGGASCVESEYGCGTIFELTAKGTESILYSFKGGSDGYYPRSTLLMDKDGNLYGTTAWGGNCSRCGTLFKLAPGGNETILHAFKGGSDGESPFAGVIGDAKGNLYGTTLSGGGGCTGYDGCGTVFKFATDGAETVLQTFPRVYSGKQPVASLLLDKGFLYGTAESGGGSRESGGVVFRTRTK